MLLDVRTFAERYFEPGQRPDPRTLRRRIRLGALPGRKIGRWYYVDEEAFLAGTGNQVVDRVLGRIRGNADGTTEEPRQ